MINSTIRPVQSSDDVRAIGGGWYDCSCATPNKPILTVVLPVYNVASYLEYSIRSIFSQIPNVDQIEVIAVDDGSTDESLAILNKLNDKYPTLIVHHQKNGGVSAARNLGIELAHGEWLTFMDPDDAYVIGSLDCLLRQLSASHADVLTFRHVVTDSQSKNVPFVCEGCMTFDMRDVNHLGHVLKNVYPIAWNACYRRTVIGDARFEIGMQPSEDSLFGFTCLSKAVSVEVLDANVYNYVQHQGSCMHVLSLNRLQSEIHAMSSLYKIAKRLWWFDTFKDVIFRKVRVEVIGDVARQIPRLGQECCQQVWNFFFAEMREYFLDRGGVYRLAFKLESPLIVKYGIVMPYMFAKSFLRCRMVMAVWKRMR